MTTSHDMILPAPWRAADAGSFAAHTVLSRLPAIARRVLHEAALAPAMAHAIGGLLAEMPHRCLTPIEDIAADVPGWNAALAPYAADDWLTAPWFLVETYFYRRLAAIAGWFAGGPDLFAVQKARGLGGAAPALASLLAGLGHGDVAVARALLAALWGNRADLSLWPLDAPAAPATTAADAAGLLCDDRAAVLARLRAAAGPVVLVADNAGFELACDLVLCDLLLAHGMAAPLTIALKAFPTFVSDATIPDALRTIALLADAGDPATARLGRRLAHALACGRLQLDADAFWTSPLAAWQAPPALRQMLDGAALVIVKGDANYRRLLGDRRWPATTPFAAVPPLSAAPLVALRTCKSEVVVGLAAGQAEALDARAADWRISGSYGVIQWRH
jgi:uncharacterized protein with ATP-grasp and redox domains